MTPIQPEKLELPLPLQAVASAGLPADFISAALIRSIEQWCAIAPLPLVVQALKRVTCAENAPTEFRRAILNLMAHGIPQQSDPPPINRLVPRTPQEEQKEVSPAVKRVLSAQMRLINMSDAEYQDELVRRLRQKRAQ